MIPIPSYSAISEAFRSLIDKRSSHIAYEIIFTGYLAHWNFDEKWYLESNPDLSHAIPSQDFPNGYSHFRGVGYVEGRVPVPLVVDSKWYMSTYPDVASAIIKGAIESSAHHFKASGYREGRLPSKPDFDIEWYSRAYLALDGGKIADEKQCLEHFMTVGYLNGALPKPSRR